MRAGSLTRVRRGATVSAAGLAAGAGAGAGGAAGGALRTASDDATFSRPPETVLPCRAGLTSTPFSSAFLTSATEAVGLEANSRAAAPATVGEENEVPSMVL